MYFVSFSIKQPLIEEMLSLTLEKKDTIVSTISYCAISGVVIACSFFAYKWLAKCAVQSCFNSFFNHQEINEPYKNNLLDKKLDLIEKNFKYVRFKKESEFNSYIYENYLDSIINSSKKLFLNDYEDIISSPYYFVLLKNVIFFGDCAKIFLKEMEDTWLKHEAVIFISNLADCKTFSDFNNLKKNEEIIWLFNDFLKRNFFKNWV